MKNSKRHTQEYINNEFLKENCECLDVYVNSDTKMKFKCKCGNIAYSSFSTFKKGHLCKKCGDIRGHEKTRHSQEFINQTFLNAGCECLDIYRNTDTPMKYRCKCGNISKICFNSFLKGSWCKLCGIKKRSGKNHHNWVKDRSNVKNGKYLHKLSSSYKQKFRKNNNIKSSTLHVDHIFPIKAFYEYNIYNLDIINCEDNLQILNAKENISKGSKYIKEEFEEYLINKNIKFKSKILNKDFNNA